MRGILGLENLDTNNIGVGIEFELLLLGGSLSWVWSVEDVIKFLKLLIKLAFVSLLESWER